MKLSVVPISFKSACSFIRQEHRHHKPPQGHKFSIGLTDGTKIIGVAIVGRPISRHLDNGKRAEVTRLCTNGVKNGCSKLYSACWQAAKAMGYTEMITYILASENGKSIEAAGWKFDCEAGGYSWNVPSRPRIDKAPREKKKRYSISV